MTSFSNPTNFERNMGRTRKLYFLRCGDYLKVGVADDIVARVRIFKIGNPYPIALDAYRTIPATLAIQIEKAVHAALSHNRHEGEWFQIEKSEALKIADAIIKKAVIAHGHMTVAFGKRAPNVQPVISAAQALDKAQLKELS